MNAARASSAERTDHEGLHRSAWKLEIDRQMRAPVSKRPERVSMVKEGGARG